MEIPGVRSKAPAPHLATPPRELPWMQQVSSLPAVPAQSDSRIDRLPLATLYLTERCNSRCITCDYSRHGRADTNLASVARLLPSLLRLQTRVVLLSGGAPLLNREWEAIAELLRISGIKTWLLTSGLSLLKYARRAGQLFDAITVSDR